MAGTKSDTVAYKADDVPFKPIPVRTISGAIPRGGVMSDKTSIRAVRPLVPQMMLTVLNRSPSQPQTNLPAAPPANSINNITLICAAPMSLASMTKGKNTRAAVRTAASRTPTPLSVMNPAICALFSDSDRPSRVSAV